MKITDPADVSITDDLRTWAAEKWGAPELPAQYLSEFQDSCAARGTKYKDAVKAFQNWITWSSPSGRYYKADVWELRLRNAKRVNNGQRLSKTPATIAGQYVDSRGRPTHEPMTARTAPDVARAALAAMMAKL